MDEDVHIKVVLLGETAVGKSCLISRFVNDVFQTNHISTLAGTFSSKTVFYDKLKKKIIYEIWDTAGQEKYRSLNKMFYHDAKVAILVLDITRKDPFHAIKNYWYLELKDNAPKNIILGLAANKSDLYEYEEITNSELEEYAKSINAEYKQTSALQNSGINDLFDAIGYKILSPENYNEFIRKSASKTQIKIISDEESESNSQVSNKKTINNKKNCC